MKKLTLLLAALALIIPASVSASRQRPLNSVPASTLKQAYFNKDSRRNIPRRDATTPKGKQVYYEKNSSGTFVLNGGLFLYSDVFPAEVIWGNGNKVYFKNFISVFPEEYYVEGTVDGSVITIPLGQQISYSEEEGFGYTIEMLKTIPTVVDGEEVYNFQYDPEIESIQLVMEGEGRIRMLLPGGEEFDGENIPGHILGVCYSDTKGFTGYGDFSQDYTELDLTLITMPEDADVKNYVYIDSFNYAYFVDVAFHGDYLYIRGLNSMLPDATLRARIEGNKAYIPQDEYLGVYYDLYYIFTKILIDNPNYDEDADNDEDAYILAPKDMEFELNIDPETNLIFTDKDGVYLSFHCNENDFLNSLGFYGIFELRYQESFAGTPSNPVDLEYHTEFAEMQGWNDFFFTLSNFSTEGNLLDAEKLYYKVFVNGTPLIFVEGMRKNVFGDDQVAYVGVPVKVELMPYYFNNNDDIFKFFDNMFDVGIYTNDVNTIGVQTVYYYDDVYTYSDIVTLNVETGEITESGVDTLPADDSVISTTYFTLDGRRILNPDRGLFIRIRHTASGATLIDKLLK